MRESSSRTTGKSSAKRFTKAGTSAIDSGPSIATPTTRSPWLLFAVVKSAQMRELGLARLAEGRPEVEQDDLLAQVIAESKRLAVDVARGEVGRDVSADATVAQGLPAVAARPPQRRRTPRARRPRRQRAPSWCTRRDRVDRALAEDARARRCSSVVTRPGPAGALVDDLHGARIDVAFHGTAAALKKVPRFARFGSSISVKFDSFFEIQKSKIAGRRRDVLRGAVAQRLHDDDPLLRRAAPWRRRTRRSLRCRARTTPRRRSGAAACSRLPHGS